MTLLCRFFSFFMAMFDVWYLMFLTLLKNLGCNMVTFFGGWYGTLVVKTLFFKENLIFKWIKHDLNRI